METVFRIKVSDLNKSFIDSLKLLFKKKTIEISVTDVLEEDETEFLLKNPINREHLLKAVEDIKNQKNLIRFTAEEFESLTHK